MKRFGSTQLALAFSRESRGKAFAALCGFLRREHVVTHEQWFIALCLALAYMLRYVLATDWMNAKPLVFATLFIACAVPAFALMAGIVMAKSVNAGIQRRTALVAAVIFSAIMFGMLRGSLSLMYDPETLFEAVISLFWGNVEVFHVSDPEIAEIRESYFGVAKWAFFEWLLFSGAAVLVYLDHQRTRTARAQRHAAEVARAHSAKRTLESKLQAMQARVEPQFLFNTLAQVGDLYRKDIMLGERMLDELIAYLRAAMPKMRDTSSTLGQEIELVRAYLGIVRLRLGQRLEFEIETPAEIADARVPPMMLLPLVDHAIAHGLAASQASGKIRIRTAIMDDRIRLEIADSGVGLLPGSEGEEIMGIRERLAALYERDASLVLKDGDSGRTEAVLEIPLEDGETRVT